MEKIIEKNSEKILESKNFQMAKELIKDKGLLFDAIMNAIGDGLSIQDLDMNIVYQNKFMMDHFGDHIGEKCYKIYEKRDEICEGCPMQSAYKDGKIHIALRTGKTKEGPFRFENIASVLSNKQGNIVAGVELCRIVEERERAFEEIRELKEIKKRAEEMEKFNKITVSRELRMVELKKENEELREENKELKKRLN